MTTTAPTNVVTLRRPAPALHALRRHVLTACRYDGDPRRCRECRELNADAAAEAWIAYGPEGER